jgi:hypothetical protein
LAFIWCFLGVTLVGGCWEGGSSEP